MAYHTDSLPDICPQANPVKEAYQGDKCALEPGGFQLDDHAIVGVRECGLMPALPSRLPLRFRVFNDSVHPVSDNRVNYQIEYVGLQWVDLRHSSLPSERFPVVTPRSSYHGQTEPVVS